MTALQLSKAIKSKQIGAAEATKAYIQAAKENKHNAFLAIDEEGAVKRAEEVQKQMDAGELTGPLAGVAIGVKDNISTAGMPTTCASKMLQNYVPVFDAAVVERLKQAGMIIIGKLNMDEFAMGSSSETGAFGAVRNPWDVTRVAGGSSGGGAAAVAAGEIPLAVGSDTGGSIRQPCAFCGITGIKPTYGAVSRYGALAFASSLDQIGPMGKDIDDCAALLSVMSGPDSRDSTCVIKEGFPPLDCSQTGTLAGVKIGIPRNYFEVGIDEDIKQAVLEAAKQLESAGATVEEFEMPYLDYIINIYHIIACAEASSNLSRFDGLNYGYRSGNADSVFELYRRSRSESFGLEVKKRVMLGSFVLSSGYYDAYYKKALQVRSMVKNEYNRLFKSYDLILTPTTPAVACKLGENIDEPMKMYMGDIYTVSVNIAGVPALSMPCGIDKRGMPVGVQLIGDSFGEDKLINAARVYQSRTDWHKKQANAAKGGKSL